MVPLLVGDGARPSADLVAMTSVRDLLLEAMGLAE
jgi:hypothetical protein